MFDLREKLLFPTIKYVEAMEFGKKGEIRSIYKLDWTFCDQTKEKKWHEWKDRCWPESGMNFPGIMPEEYMKWMDEKLFCISATYMTEIKRNTMKVFEEWFTNRPFDTIIRDMCLLPAISHTMVAFKLIEDCIYSPSTKYYDRHGSNIILSYAMLFRFWIHQTGRGCVERHSDFKRLEDIGKIDHLESIELKQIKEFFKSIEQFKKGMEKEMAKMHKDGPLLDSFLKDQKIKNKGK